MGEVGIKVYGTSWCVDCFRARRFLDAHQIAYQWINIKQDTGAQEFVRKANQGNLSVPTIVFEDGTILSEPSNSELKQKLGLAEN